MFRPQMLAIFRLYNETLSVIHACVGGYRVQGGGGVRARSRKCGEVGGALDLGWLGTVYRQRTMPTYNDIPYSLTITDVRRKHKIKHKI
jgi:hypothetical protein